jgi:hypothetical protein
MTKECLNIKITKAASLCAFELRPLGFFRHYGLGIRNFGFRPPHQFSSNRPTANPGIDFGFGF